MEVVTSATKIPTTDEWVMSTEPTKFVIVLRNDTEFFKDYDRVAVLCRVGDRVVDSSEPNKSQFSVHITGFRALIGKEPGEDLDDHPDVQAFCRSPGFEDKIADALNLWGTAITEDQKMDVWMAGNRNPLGILETLLGK